MWLAIPDKSIPISLKLLGWLRGVGLPFQGWTDGCQRLAFISRWQGAVIDWNGTEPILWLMWPALYLGRTKGNDWISTFLFPPIQEMGQFEMRKNDMVYRLAEFHLSHLVLRIFCLQYKQRWRKFLVAAFSVKLRRAGWVPTTKPRLQMKQRSRQRALEVSFWIHSVSCNCLGASDGRCWTQISLAFTAFSVLPCSPLAKLQCHYKTSSKEQILTSLPGVSKPHFALNRLVTIRAFQGKPGLDQVLVVS